MGGWLHLGSFTLQFCEAVGAAEDAGRRRFLQEKKTHAAHDTVHPHKEGICEAAHSDCTGWNHMLATQRKIDHTRKRERSPRGGDFIQDYMSQLLGWVRTGVLHYRFGKSAEQ